MSTLKRYRCRAALASLLALGCADVVAVPTLEAPPNWQARGRKPPPSAAPPCGGQRADADTATAAHAGRAPPEGGEANLDGTNRCRLVDAERDEEKALNEGMDPDALLKLLEEFAAMGRPPGSGEEQDLLDPLTNNVHVEVDPIDHELHAYIGTGPNRQDLGQLSRQDTRQSEEDGLQLLHFGEESGYADAHRRRSGAIDSNARLGPTAAIPEPGMYAMLLSGLALLALARRHRHRAQAPPGAEHRLALA